MLCLQGLIPSYLSLPLQIGTKYVEFENESELHKKESWYTGLSGKKWVVYTLYICDIQKIHGNTHQYTMDVYTVYTRIGPKSQNEGDLKHSLCVQKPSIGPNISNFI